MKSLKKLLNALSVLLLGTSTSLNAQTPPQKPQPAPQTTQRPPVQKTEKDSKPIKYNTPILTPEQVIEGLLRLVDSLHGSTDLTPERVKATLGIDLKQEKEGKFWRYSFANAFQTLKIGLIPLVCHLLLGQNCLLCIFVLPLSIVLKVAFLLWL